MDKNKITVALEKLARQEEQIGPGHADLVPFLVEVSEVYQEKGQYREARNYYERAIKILTLHLTEIHPYLLPYFSQFIELNLEGGSSSTALNYWKKGALLIKYFPDENSELFAQVSLKLCSAALDKRKVFYKKKKLFSLTTSLLVKYGRENDKVLIRLYKRLVETNTQDVSLDETIRHENEFLRLTSLYFGEKSDEFIEACILVRSKYISRKEYRKAIQLCEKFMKISIELHGENSIEMVKNYAYLSSSYNGISQLKALNIRFKALKILERFFSERYSEISSEYYTLGAHCKTLKKYDLGIKYYKKALHVRKKCDEDKVSWVYKTDIADLYSKKGDYENEIVQRNELIEDLTLLNEKGHSYAISVQYDKLGLACHKSKKYEQAIECRKKSIKITETDIKNDI